MLIGLAGKARVGKDTAAKYLVERYGFNQIALADPVKESYYRLNPHIVLELTFAEELGLDLTRDGYTVTVDKTGAASIIQLFITDVKSIVDRVGWEKAKTIKGIRTGLQKIGTECGREIHGDDCWLNIAKKKFTGKDVISDARFSNEAEFTHAFGGTVVNLTRNDAEEVAQHSSENGLCSEYYDVLVENNGTVEDLYEELDKIVQ
jgi:hypothetical protein